MSTSPASCSRCGHAQEAHEHYRRGTDCALCDCPAYRGPAGLLRRLLGRDERG